jgi:HSP20 family protein
MVYSPLTQKQFAMIKNRIRNRAFTRIGDRYSPVIDHDHFLGFSAFDVKRAEKVPPVNVIREEELYVMEIVVPGFSKEELNISVKNDVLTVSGRHTEEREEKKEGNGFVLQEYNLNSFERSFMLSPEISHEKITAKYENGILRIKFTDVPPELEKDAQEVMVE